MTDRDDTESQEPKQVTIAEVLSKVELTESWDALAKLTGQTDAQIRNLRDQLAVLNKDFQHALGSISLAIDRSTGPIEKAAEDIGAITRHNRVVFTRLQATLQQTTLFNQQDWRNLQTSLTRAINQFSLNHADMLAILTAEVPDVDISVLQEFRQLARELKDNTTSDSSAVASPQPSILQEFQRFVVSLPIKQLKQVAWFIFGYIILPLALDYLADTRTRQQLQVIRQDQHRISREMTLAKEHIAGIRSANSLKAEAQESLEACITAYNTVMDELSSRTILVASRELPIRLSADSTADTVQVIPPDTQLELVNHEGKWSKVRVQHLEDAGTVEGWVLSDGVRLLSQKVERSSHK